LLAYLGAESGLHARDALAALLWPETAGGDARSSLRTTLVDLRRVLGESALTATRETVGLAPSVALDLDLQPLRQARGLVRALDGAPGLRAHLEQAVALYRGPFLAGLDVPDAPEFETWLEGQRTHWLGVTVELLERLATLQADAGDVGAVQADVGALGGAGAGRGARLAAPARALS
jgi:DNA-binding SARP family transcriptional activator